MESEPPKADHPKRKRRWLQFSLRSLLIFTLICAGACGWLGKKIERAKRQMQAVARIDSLHGYAKYEREPSDEAPTGTQSWLISVFGKDFVYPVVGVTCGRHTHDADLAILDDLPMIKTLELCGTEVTDDGLAFLPQLQQLATLDISNTRITDAGLKRVAQVRSLNTLRLNNSYATHAASYSQSWPEYRDLDLSGGLVSHSRASTASPWVNVSCDLVIVTGTIGPGQPAVPLSIRVRDFDSYDGVSSRPGAIAGPVYVRVPGYGFDDWYCAHQPEIGDAGLEHLAQLLNLESLDLEGTDVTSKGILRLKGLRHLTHLSVLGTNVSDAAISELKLALPKLQVDKLFPSETDVPPFAVRSRPFAPSTSDLPIDFGIPGQPMPKSFNP